MMLLNALLLIKMAPVLCDSRHCGVQNAKLWYHLKLFPHAMGRQLAHSHRLNACVKSNPCVGRNSSCRLHLSRRMKDHVGAAVHAETAVHKLEASKHRPICKRRHYAVIVAGWSGTLPWAVHQETQLSGKTMRSEQQHCSRARVSSRGYSNVRVCEVNALYDTLHL